MKTSLTRRWLPIAVIAFATGFITGCVGGSPFSSWPAVIVSEETAYLASDQAVYAIDTDTNTNNNLRQKWIFPSGEADGVGGMTFHAQPILSDEGILYFASDSLGTPSGRIFAMDAETGRVRWRFPSQNEETLANIFGGLAYDGESLYANTSTGFVISVDADPQTGGTLNWTFDTEVQLWSTPVFSDSTVYVASQDHHLYALNADNGNVKWSFEAEAMLAGTPTVHGDTVYVGSFDQKMYAINASNGRLRWAFEASGWLWDGPAIFDDTLYFGDLNGILYAVNRNGRMIWSETLDGAIRATPLVTADRIYVGTRARLLYALNRVSGNAVWPAPLIIEQDGAELLTTPVLIDNTLYVAPLPAGGEPVRLIAINAESGNPEWTFPPPAQQQ